MEATNTPSAVNIGNVQAEVARSISVAWEPFSEKLAAVIANLEEDQYLILSKKRSFESVQFAGQGSFGLRLETTSNYFRDQENQLTEQQVSSLTDLGWNLPTRNPAISTPQSDPDGSPNLYIDISLPLNFRDIADLTVSTFSEILSVPHPGFLEFDAFDADGNSLPLPTLGLKRANNAGEADQNSKLPQLLLDTLKEVTGIHSLEFDEDGYVGGIDADSVTTFVSILADRQYIRLNAMIIKGVKESKALLKKINEMNGEVGYMHLVVSNRNVIVFSDVLVEPLVASHVAIALDNFCLSANAMKSELEAEFGDVKLESEQQSTLVTH